MAQYDAYEALPGLHLKGRQTLAENIADVAGLSAAYDAYKASLGGKEAPVIDGLTGPQRFFVGIGQVWRYKDTEETARNRVGTDPHSPPRCRVFGPLRNMPEFQKAFSCPAGSFMAPADRCRVW